MALAMVLLCVSPAEVALAAPDMCDPDTGRFRSSRQGLMVSADDTNRVNQSMDWLRSMMEPLRSSGDGSTITPAQDYNTDYQGPVEGTFTLANPGNYSVVNPSPITVTSPSDLEGQEGYRGQVSGTAPAGANRVVKAYLYTDTEYEQPDAVPAVVNPDGTWTIDLSPVPANRAGVWHFRLHDTATNTDIGESWPRDGYYQNLEVQAYSVTDAMYPLGTQPAREDNTFSFANVTQGNKLFRLVDTSSNTILAEYFQPETHGLIRSYEYHPGQDGFGTPREHYTYLYDQALALMVAVGADDRAMADRLLDGLQAVQIPAGQPHAGAFPSSAHQLDPNNRQPTHYTGGNAFVAYALIRYQERYGDTHGVSGTLAPLMQWIASMKTTSGDGTGLYRGGFRNNAPITWHSTEHNIDLWHVFERGARVLGNDEYKQEADALAKTIVSKLWNDAEGRFDQGLNDSTKALDTSSWGSVFLNAIGEREKAVSALRFVDNFAYGQGYTPYLDIPATDTVWLEGTFGVAHAQAAAGEQDRALATIRNTYSLQAATGAWPYATEPDTINELTNADSVASTAWHVLAAGYPEAAWSECIALAGSSNSRTGGVPGQLAPTGSSPWNAMIAGTALLLVSGIALRRLPRKQS
ncbi:hypothetical protein CR983_01135 [Candidatus Saccharibacteria bacterium]|nr:MAG: hypothetical protein CR983_01135 [Candidatus Saccharibacteria bacterium]